MSKKFYAVHKMTGERWKPKYPKNSAERQYLVMYDSGYLAVVTENFYTYIEPLGSEWEIVFNGNGTT